jgi:cytochrome c biogenesis protein CcdA
MKLTTIFHAFQTFMKSLTSWILLTVVYYIGVGVTSLVAKVSGKRFLHQEKRESSWNKHTSTNTFRSMY